MGFKIDKNVLNGLLVITPPLFEDERGFFSEIYNERAFQKFGVNEKFVQDDHSKSLRGVLRGLHFQWKPKMGKLVRVSRGEVFFVAVDIRNGSPTFSNWHGEIVSGKNKKEIWIPMGFASGFYVLSDFAEVQYKCTGIYNPEAESIIKWDDPEIGIEWPLKEELILSEKDKNAQTFSEWNNKEESKNFKY